MMQFIIDHRDTFVGVDLANDETKFPPEPFYPMFREAITRGLQVTIHAGESLIPSAAENVRSAITHLGAKRIGHGIMISENGDIKRFVKDSKTVLEVCPSSNWIVGLFKTIAEHPLRRLKLEGILVTISTDDPGLFGISLTEEYVRVVENGLMTIEELRESNEVGLRASFLAEDVKKKFWGGI